MDIKQNLTKLLLENYRGTGAVATEFSNMSKEEKDDKIRQAFFSVLGTKEIKDEIQLAKLLRAKGNEVFEIIENVITEGMIRGDWRNAFFDKFVEEHNLDLGDENTFYIEGENELQVAKIAGDGTTVDRQRIDNGHILTVDMDTYGIAVYEYLIRALTGRTDFAVLVAKLNEAVEKAIKQQTYVAFQELLTKLPSYYTHTGTYDKEKILEVIQAVQVATGVKPQLVGTSLALSKLQNKEIVNFSDSMKDERNRQGYISTWEGYACVEIEQTQKIGKPGVFNFSNDEIYVIAGHEKPVKLTLRSGLIDPNGSGVRFQDRSMNFQYEFDFGVAIVTAAALGRISLA